MKKIVLLLLVLATSCFSSEFEPLVGFKGGLDYSFNDVENETKIYVSAMTKYWRFRAELPIFQETLYYDNSPHFSLNGIVGATNGTLLLLGIYNNYKPVLYVNAALFAITAVPNIHINFEVINRYLFIEGGHNLDIFIKDGSLAPVYSLQGAIELKVSPCSLRAGIREVVYDGDLYSGKPLFTIGAVLSID